MKTIDEATLARVFDEWQKRFEADPFDFKFDPNGATEGEQRAAYVFELAKEIPK